MADDSPGVTPEDTVKSCNDQGRPGCYAAHIPAVGVLSYLGISVHAETYDPDGVKDLTQDAAVIWLPILGVEQRSVGYTAMGPQALYLCRNDKESLSTSSLPPVRRRGKRTLPTPAAAEAFRSFV